MSTELSNNKNILICFMGTGKYINFFNKFYETAKNNFLLECNKKFLIFTDSKLEQKDDTIIYNIDHKKWPFITLYRFKNLLLAEKEIIKYDWFVYVDADMYFNENIKYEEFFDESKKLFGVQHPAFINKIGTFEYNKNSLAAIDILEDDLSIYWQGCLWGGKPADIIKLCKELNNRIDEDLKKNIIAVWHDESHMNKYFIENKLQVHTLSPSYAYPELWNIPFKKKIVHAHKDNSTLQI